MKVYLDASVLVALLTADALTARAETLMQAKTFTAVVSDFAVAEVVSAIARRVRTKSMALAAARGVFSNLDNWVIQFAAPAQTTAADVKRADATMRRLDLNLRTPDALHIAIAERLGAEMATFDDRMASAARVLGLSVTMG